MGKVMNNPKKFLRVERETGKKTKCTRVRPISRPIFCSEFDETQCRWKLLMRSTKFFFHFLVIEKVIIFQRASKWCWNHVATLRWYTGVTPRISLLSCLPAIQRLKTIKIFRKRSLDDIYWLCFPKHSKSWQNRPILAHFCWNLPISACVALTPFQKAVVARGNSDSDKSELLQHHWSPLQAPDWAETAGFFLLQPVGRTWRKWAAKGGWLSLQAASSKNPALFGSVDQCTTSDKAIGTQHILALLSGSVLNKNGWNTNKHPENSKLLSLSRRYGRKNPKNTRFRWFFWHQSWSRQNFMSRAMFWRCHHCISYRNNPPAS